MSFLCYRIIREPVERYRACKLSTAKNGINFKAPLDLNEKRRGFSHAFVIWVNDVISVWWNQFNATFSYLIYHTIILVLFDFFNNNWWDLYNEYTRSWYTVLQDMLTCSNTWSTISIILVEPVIYGFHTWANLENCILSEQKIRAGSFYKKI